MRPNNLIESKQTIPANNSTALNCAKECPCGVPVIPVPDQWLEVVVTGGFKVWHIIFIIIALIVIMTVVYCCFHRCRIPRTKQEIEADLMRSTLANKFSEYMQELSSEPVSFIEALKRVQELEEKLEQDDALAREAQARKRMGWLKLKGKGDKDAAANKAAAAAAAVVKNVADISHQLTTAAVAAAAADEKKQQRLANATDAVEVNLVAAKEKQAAFGIVQSAANSPTATNQSANEPATAAAMTPTPISMAAIATNATAAAEKSKKAPEMVKATDKTRRQQPQVATTTTVAAATTATATATATIATVTATTGGDQEKQQASDTVEMAAKSNGAGANVSRPTGRRRRHKPNLSRTKATRDRSASSQLDIGSIKPAEHVSLELPVPNNRHSHHHHRAKGTAMAAKSATTAATTTGLT